MEDFIYLLALLAWVVFAFYRRSQKKAEQARKAAGQPGDEDRPRPMPTLEEILLGEEQIPEYEATPLPTRPVRMEPVPSKYDETAFEKEYNRRGITSLEELDKPLTLTPLDQLEVEIEDLSADRKTFDPQSVRKNIREAVIYSEILNRPYVS